MTQLPTECGQALGDRVRSWCPVPDEVPRGADLVVETLVRLGVKHAFNVIGLGMYDLGHAFHERRDDIAYISHLNETNLALMAQGYARGTGKPAFCFVYYASGTGLAMASLTSAWADRAPLVLVSTTNTQRVGGRDQYAATPRSILEMGAQFSKWSYEVPSVERIPEILARAYAIAAQAPMGPVHISIPADLFGELAHGPVVCSDFNRTASFNDGQADEEGLAEAARLLVQARSPVVIAGSEVGQLGAVAELVEVAEALGAPVMIENMPSYLSFPTTHSQYVGMMKANGALRADADVVLAVGVEFTPAGFVNEPPSVLPDTKLISLSVDPALTVRQQWPDISLSGHPRASLGRLAELLREAGVSDDLRASGLAHCLTARATRRAAANAIAGMDRSRSPVAPAQIVDEIAKFCGQDWIVMNSGTTAGDDFDVVHELDDPSKFHALSGKGSCQGWGGPVSIGVQLANPDRRVMTLIGDGNLMFTGTSIWAAARYCLPMVFVVANNGGWAHIHGAMGDAVADDALAQMSWTFDEAPIDYVGFARSLGLMAEKANSAAELGRLLASTTGSSGPMLIEVPTAQVATGVSLVTPRPKLCKRE